MLAAQVHEELTADVQIGDYIRLPFVPVVKVIDKIEDKGGVTFIVQAGTNLPEEWKIEVAVEVKTVKVVQQVKQEVEVVKQLVYTATPYYRQVVVNSRKPKTKAQRRAAAIFR